MWLAPAYAAARHENPAMNVLLLGNYRPSLPVARTLARAGHAVFCGVDRPAPYLFASRYVRGCFAHARIDERPELALADIRAYLARNPAVDAVMPISEPAMRLLSAHRDVGRPGLRLILPSAKVVNACIDKAFMFDLCERVGAPVAAQQIVQDRPSLEAAVREIGAPCVIKPVDDFALLFGAKAIILRTPRELDTALPHWPAEHVRLCVQRYVKGPRDNVVFAARNGRLVGAVEFRSLRTDRVDETGFSTLVASVEPNPAVRKATEALVESLRYTGVGMLQFMIDAAGGEVSFLELNPRLGGTSTAAEACGLPICRLMLDLGAGVPVAVPENPWRYPRGVRVVWTRGDLGGLVAEWKRGALSPAAALRWSAAAAAGVFARHHLTFDPTDPGPSLRIYLEPLLRRAGLVADPTLGPKFRCAPERVWRPAIVPEGAPAAHGRRGANDVGRGVPAEAA